MAYSFEEVEAFRAREDAVGWLHSMVQSLGSMADEGTWDDPEERRQFIELVGSYADSVIEQANDGEAAGGIFISWAYADEDGVALGWLLPARCPEPIEVIDDEPQIYVLHASEAGEIEHWRGEPPLIRCFADPGEALTAAAGLLDLRSPVPEIEEVRASLARPNRRLSFEVEPDNGWMDEVTLWRVAVKP